MVKFNVKKAVVATLGVAASVGAMAQSVTPPTFADPVQALESLSGTASGFAPILYGLAVVSSGIVLGIAWIKKSRSAAK